MNGSDEENEADNFPARRNGNAACEQISIDQVRLPASERMSGMAASTARSQRRGSIRGSENGFYGREAGRRLRRVDGTKKVPRMLLTFKQRWHMDG